MGRCPACGASFLGDDYCPECGHVLEEVVRLRVAFDTPDDLRSQFGRFPTFERFFLPSAQPVPEGTLVELSLALPAPWGDVSAPARVTAIATTPSTPATPYRLQLSLLRMDPGKKALMRSIVAEQAPPEVGSDTSSALAPPALPPQAPEGPPAPARVQGADRAVDIEELLRPPDRLRPKAPARERREPEEGEPLTREPEEVAEALAEFVRRLTKALTSSSYYQAEHASALQAKVGLYDAFLLLVQESPEVTLLAHSTDAKRSLLVHGVLEEPTDLARVLPRGQAELLVLKLESYFEARSLLSVSFKRSLGREEFHRFVDLLAGSEVARGDRSGFATALAEQQIENVSVVFKEDLIRKRKLSWRVELALTRLKTDLSVVPLYKGRSPAELRRVRREVFRDVVRPLRRIPLIRELLTNCDLVAQEVSGVSQEEMELQVQEAVIPAALPELLAGFAEDVLEAMHGHDPERSEHLLRLTRNLARKLAGSGEDVSQPVFRQLFDRELLALEELPPALQHRIHVERKVDAFLKLWHRQLEAFDEADSAEEYRRHLDFFSLIFGELLARHALDVAVGIALLVARHRMSEGFPGREALAVNWSADFGEGPAGEEIVHQLMGRDKLRRKALFDLCRILGEGAVPILFKALCECTARSVRQEICDLLEELEEPTERFLAAELEKKDIPWYFQRNLLDVLGRVGDAFDAPLAARFLDHEHPRVRLEAFLTTCRLDPFGAERVLLRGLGDAEPGVRAVCLRQLVKRHSAARELFAHVKRLALSPGPGEEQAAAEACARLANYAQGPGREEAVSLLIEVVGGEPKKAFWFRLGRDHEAQEKVRVAACEALARMRAEKAVPILTHLAEGPGKALKHSAAHALQAIQGAPEAGKPPVGSDTAG